MEKSGKQGGNGLTTNEIILRLRMRIERAYSTNQTKLVELLTLAADRLRDQEDRIFELEERIAIMEETGNPTEEQLAFPPEDAEIGGDGD